MPTSRLSPRLRRFVLLLGVLVFTGWLYWPGLSGPWLLDDDMNLGPLQAAPAGSLDVADYRAIIFGNRSGPLGRPVAMASFAADHALGQFSTPRLKLGNVLLHLGNGILLYHLLASLFRIRSPLARLASPRQLALLLTAWWLILPIHISAVLYIVQRMTLLATFFALASCLAYVAGRARLREAPRRGWLLLGLSLVGCFPLAVLAKENAVVTAGWLLLIELFFFRDPGPGLRLPSRQNALRLLLVLAVLAGVVVVKAGIHTDGYLWRDFTLTERLLTQPHALATYMRDILIPHTAAMGIYQDDFPVSRSLLDPLATLPALLLLAGLLLLATETSASRWWGVSFGLLFYFTGHLVESTVIPLELYFEHRNYLPSAGLLLAAASAIGVAWPARRQALVLVLGTYLALLTLASFQRIHIWSDRQLLIEASALQHPHSLRAWTDYPEELLHQGKPRLALEASLRSAEANPGFASISYLQMLSIYCRIKVAPPAALIVKTADALQQANDLSSSTLTPITIGLERVLADSLTGHCQSADFGPLAMPLARLNARVVRHFGPTRTQLWFLRLTLAEWLLHLHRPDEALTILEDIWRIGDRNDLPTPGLALAKALVEQGKMARARQVLAELAAVTHDAPDDFRAEMATLRQRTTGKE